MSVRISSLRVSSLTPSPRDPFLDFKSFSDTEIDSQVSHDRVETPRVRLKEKITEAQKQAFTPPDLVFQAPQNFRANIFDKDRLRCLPQKNLDGGESNQPLKSLLRPSVVRGVRSLGERLLTIHRSNEAVNQEKGNQKPVSDFYRKPWLYTRRESPPLPPLENAPHLRNRKRSSRQELQPHQLQGE